MKKNENNEKFYKEIVENCNSIIMRFDVDGEIKYINNFGLKIFEYSREELLGKKIVGTIIEDSEVAGENFKEMIYKITHFPERYKNNSGFIITSISHNIGRDGWTTTLGTQFRVTPIKNTTNETKDKIKLNYWNYIPVNGSRPSRHRE